MTPQVAQRRVADRYLLGQQIGVGGSSRVFAALDERLGRRVAVKVLDARLAESADPNSRERFLREGPTLASFLHRHVVAVFDAGEDSGDLYIVMELVDGPSLADVLAAKGQMPVVEAVRIATQVLAALAAAHDAGILHRDVKPGNILLAPDGDAKLTDFGIAKRFNEIEESVTHTGSTIGTPGYLTPEQATGSALSPATDVYAMGAVLFEMLAGRTAFRGGSPVAVAVAQQQGPAPDVREFRADVPPALAAVIARALERSPADRYATAADMDSALGAAWSPSAGAGPIPAPAMATTVMGIPPAAQSGHTTVMPNTSVAPPVAEPSRSPAPAHRSPGWIAFVVIVLAMSALAAVLSRSDDGSSGTSSVTTPSPATLAPATPTPVIADTAPPSSEAPVTTVPATVPIVEEIIPGFSSTDDLATFLQQLENDPDLVGPAGDELAAELDRLLDESSGRKQRDRAKALTSQLQEWVDEEQLHPAIAQALSDLLAPLAAKGKP